jgi:hypothetical protein
LCPWKAATSPKNITIRGEEKVERKNKAATWSGSISDTMPVASPGLFFPFTFCTALLLTFLCVDFFFGATVALPCLQSANMHAMRLLTPALG